MTNLTNKLYAWDDIGYHAAVLEVGPTGPVRDIADAECVCEAYVKWDGGSDWSFDESVHLSDGAADVDALATMMKRVLALGPDLITKWSV